jgi:ABC-2 type transport system permease protein
MAGWPGIIYAFALDLIWLGLAAWLFMAQFQAARVRGALMNIGE